MVMSLGVRQRDQFIAAASAPRGAHTSGTLEDAEAILGAHPEVAVDDIYAAAVLGDCREVERLLAEDPPATDRARRAVRLGPADDNLTGSKLASSPSSSRIRGRVGAASAGKLLRDRML